jgi:hypothetical protein
MDTRQNKLNQFKDKQPFKLPDNYMEGLTEQIMNGIPEAVSLQNEQPPTLMTKLRPYFYMAAMFASMVFVLRLLIGDAAVDTKSTLETPNMYTAISEESADDEFLEYIEEQYDSSLLKEELSFFD